MFWPAEISPWMYGFLIFTVLMVLGPNLSPENWEFFFGMAGFSSLIGGMMVYHMRKWVRWSWSQRLKSSARLREEALSHPVQPRFTDDGCFAEWAGQFLDEKEVDALMEKYRSQTNSE